VSGLWFGNKKTQSELGLGYIFLFRNLYNFLIDFLIW
jgi:hypothetical protein